MKRGDKVQITAGDYRGRQGKLICLFQGQATILQADSTAIMVAAKEVRVIRQEVTAGD